MGKVNHEQDAVNQCVTQCNQRINAALSKANDELAYEGIPGIAGTLAFLKVKMGFNFNYKEHPGKNKHQNEPNERIRILYTQKG